MISSSTRASRARLSPTENRREPPGRPNSSTRPRAECAARPAPRDASANLCARRGGAAPGPSGDGIARVGRSTKGRRGKTVSTVTGVPDRRADRTASNSPAKDAQAACGTGGALKDGVIEIQGDHRDTLVEELENAGLHGQARRLSSLAFVAIDHSCVSSSRHRQSDRPPDLALPSDRRLRCRISSAP